MILLECKALIFCLQFLTRLPLPFRIEGPDDLFARGTVFFPLAGALIGVLDAAVYWLISQWAGPWTAACLVVLFDSWITGGLHLDGLADTADAFGSWQSRDRMLEIMKDSRIGTAGVLAVAGVLIGRIALYGELMSRGLPLRTLLGIIAVIPCISRTGMVMLIYASRYARENGLGGMFFMYRNKIDVAFFITLILAAGLIYLLLPSWISLILVGTSCITGLLHRVRCYRKIGGMTGDTLGAGLEWMEAAMGLAAVIAVFYLV
ncbi:MAG: adenosylcobinamide-GDP ribazoletransferase [Clostridiales bacterium]|nr:adenosylcobinamide-GDP ribazoletransferase [Clostridiales bacterium]